MAKDETSAQAARSSKIMAIAIAATFFAVVLAVIVYAFVGA